MPQEYLVCPITALVHVEAPEPLIASGEGPFLKLFKCIDGTVLLDYRIFDSQAIHGLSRLLGADNNIIFLVWGGQSVSIVKVHVKEYGSVLEASIQWKSTEVRCTQWVLCGKLLRDPEASHGDGATVAVLGTAFNGLLYVESEGTIGGSQTISLIPACQGPPSMLYSLEFHIHETQLWIASGTLFGELFLWCHSLGEPAQQHSKILKCTGHEGSVFGISIGSSSSGRMILVTCSDDRTIRVWDVGDRMARTGASDGSVDLLSDPVAQASGHLSRIWAAKLVLLNDCSGLILSCGEDGAVQEWSLTMPKLEEPAGKWKLWPINRRKLHAGRNIWSIDSTYTGDSVLMSTGGAGGRIILLEAGENVRPDNITAAIDCKTSIVLESGELSLVPKSTATEMLVAVVWLDGRCLLAVTSTGRVMAGELRTAARVEAPIPSRPSPIKWTTLFQSENLAPHATVCRLGIFGAAITGIQGSLYLYNASEKCVTHIDDIFRVKAMFNLEIKRKGVTYPALLVTSPVEDSCSVFVFEPQKTSKFDIQLPPKFVITSVALIENESLLMIGARNGTMAMWSMKDLLNVTLEKVFPSIHGRDAVTGILDLGQSKLFGNLVLTVGRDNNLMIHAIDRSTTPYTLVKMHEAEVPMGICAEGIMLTPVTNELVIWGFNGVHLVTFNLSQDTEIIRINTGGSHRAWDMLHWAAGPNSVRAAWVRSNQCYIYASDHSVYIPQAGTHGREIKSLAIQPGGEFLATGSEDTMIYISGYANEPRRLQVLSRIKKHITGICALCWSEDGRYLFSAAGKEEFFVWRIRQLPYVGIGVVCIAECPPVTEASDLRITDFDAIALKAKVDDDGFLICMVYSDSTTRLWVLDTKEAQDKRFQLVAEGTYGSRCLTRTLFVRAAGRPDNFITGSTDGHLALWALPIGLETAQYAHTNGISKAVWPILRQKVHQSAIKALDMCCVEGIWLIATGGDDNAIGITYLSGGGEAEVSFSTLLIPKAHAAAVTGVRVLYEPERDPKKVLIATASNDQTIKRWIIEIGTNEDSSQGRDMAGRVNVHKETKWDSSIADICDIGVLERDSGRPKLVVAGVGVEVWQLPA